MVYFVAYQSLKTNDRAIAAIIAPDGELMCVTVI